MPSAIDHNEVLSHQLHLLTNAIDRSSLPRAQWQQRFIECSDDGSSDSENQLRELHQALKQRLQQGHW